MIFAPLCHLSCRPSLLYGGPDPHPGGQVCPEPGQPGGVWCQGTTALDSTVNSVLLVSVYCLEDEVSVCMLESLLCIFPEGTLHGGSEPLHQKQQT